MGTSAVARADGPLEAIHLLSLSEADGTAVVRAAGGKLELVSAGELVPGTSARVAQVLPDRLVLADGDDSTGLIRIWLFRGGGDGPRLQRLDREPPPRPSLSEPRPAEPAAADPSDADPGR